jgi:hypothetical protein
MMSRRRAAQRAALNSGARKKMKRIYVPTTTASDWKRLLAPRDDRGDLPQQPTAQTLPAPRQPTPVLVGQAQSPAAQLRPENPVFCDQICQGFLPLVVPPARKGHQQ